MGVYLKQFENHTRYNNYINGNDAILPNVSLCVQENEVYYNPYVSETKLVVYYNIQNISNPTTVCTNYDNSVKSIEVDGTLLDSVVTTYQFDSVGEHIIKYEFNNPTKIGDTAPLFMQISNIKRVVIPNVFTSIGNHAFNTCGLTSVTIPDSVTSIGTYAFYNCSSLTSCTIGNGVTSISEGSFKDCSGLTNIGCNATTAPTITSNTFESVKANGTLTVPIGSTGYDVWMGTDDYYLGKYNWTKLEQ